MLTFNELRIDNTNNLIVDVSVLDSTLDIHKTIAINHVYVGFGTNIISDCIDLMEGITSSSPEVIETATYQGNVYIRRVRFEIDLTSDPIQTIKKNAEKTLVYVKVTTDVPDDILPNIPCGVDTTIEGYTYSKCMLFNNVFDYIKQTDSCEDISNYANYIVQVKGLELAVESGNFSLANLYWNKFFNLTYNGTTFKNDCGCHR